MNVLCIKNNKIIIKQLFCVDARKWLLYKNFYNHKNHLELYKTIRKITKNWIVTYDNCEEIKKIYKKFDFVEFDIKYSLENKMKAKEIMIFSKNIKNHDIFTMK